MKDATNTQFMSSDTELLEKAGNNKLSSLESQEFQISGSPFKLVNENGKWFAAWGKGKMTADFDTADEVLKWIEENHWNFWVTVMTMAMDSRDLYKIDQMMKHQKRLENAAEKGKKTGEKIDKEYTLHGEIERLKQQEEFEIEERLTKRNNEGIPVRKLQ